MKILGVATEMSLITILGQVFITTTSAPAVTVIGDNKLDRLETLKLLTDRIMHEDAELLRELAKL